MSKNGDQLYQPIVPNDQIQYREYKLLLKADRFHKPEAFHKFWKILHHAGKATDVELTKPDKEISPHVREVIFFDTPKHKLYNHSFILRKRTFYKHGLPDRNFELVLKFRNPDQKTAASVDVRPLLPCVHVIKFKEEILLPTDGSNGVRVIYSHNCELDTPNTMLLERFETTAQAFPALRRVEANPKNPLSVVNGASIEEYMVNLGMVDFGGHMSAKADVAVWRVRTTDTPLVAEFGFQIKFDRPEELHKKPRERSEAFYREIQLRAADWIYRGTTKTALIYGLGNSQVKHQE